MHCFSLCCLSQNIAFEKCNNSTYNVLCWNATLCFFFQWNNIKCNKNRIINTLPYTIWFASSNKCYTKNRNGNWKQKDTTKEAWSFILLVLFSMLNTNSNDTFFSLESCLWLLYRIFCNLILSIDTNCNNMFLFNLYVFIAFK